MRRLLTVICTLLLSASVSGQQIKSRPVGFDDFRSLLEAAGYEVHTVGDCAEPYNIQKAVLSGNLVARAL